MDNERLLSLLEIVIKISIELTKIQKKKNTPDIVKQTSSNSSQLWLHCKSCNLLKNSPVIPIWVCSTEKTGEALALAGVNASQVLTLASC